MFVRFFVVKSSLLVLDPFWGTTPANGSCTHQGREGFSTTCYKSNNEVNTPFHDGLPVVVLGDSYTEAIQVNDSQKYVSLAEIELRNRGYVVDLHNLGSSNRTLADFVYVAPAVNSAFDPEIVVIQTNESGLYDTLNPARLNHFEPQADGSLKLIHRDLWNEKDVAGQNLVLSSGLATYFSIRWKKIVGAYQVAGNKYVEPPRATTDQLTSEISQLAAAYPNSKIVFLIIPTIPVISDTEVEWVNPKDSSVVRLLNNIDGITVVYPAPAFRQHYRKHMEFPRGFFNTLPNFSHLNPLGHQLVASELVKALVQVLK